MSRYDLVKNVHMFNTYIGFFRVMNLMDSIYNIRWFETFKTIMYFPNYAGVACDKNS